MVDYREEYVKMSSTYINTQRLCPLMPRLPISRRSGTGGRTNNSSLFSSSYAYACSIHKYPNNIRAALSNCVSSEMTGMPLVSTRWNPTPEQLEALEEMYRDGTKTPSAAQIQEIASKLRRFGKIEGKNVFYWFQNHKARERQKKRRHLELRQLGGHKKKQPSPSGGFSRRNMENVERPEKQPTLLSNCTTPQKDSVSMNGAVVIADCQKDGWTKFYETQLLPKNETFWQFDLSSSTTPFNNSNKIMSQNISFQENVEKPSKSIGVYYKENDKTLELFPINTSNLRTLEEETNDVLVVGTKFTPIEFFEFLPIKN